MEQLAEKAATMGMDHLGQTPVTGNTPVIIADNNVLVVERRLVDGGNLDDDETRSAAGPGLVIGDQLVTNHPLLGQVGLMTGGENPVAKLDTADGERREQMRE